MAHYLVTAQAITDRLAELKERLDAEEIRPLRPFGRALDHALQNARLNEAGLAVWEEEDYCHPPLAMEREAVLDHYFTDLTVKPVRQGEGWREIDSWPSLWQAYAGEQTADDD
jgi:hypothetical protein